MRLRFSGQARHPLRMEPHFTMAGTKNNQIFPWEHRFDWRSFLIMGNATHWVVGLLALSTYLPQRHPFATHFSSFDLPSFFRHLWHQMNFVTVVVITARILCTSIETAKELCSEWVIWRSSQELKFLANSRWIENFFHLLRKNPCKWVFSFGCVLVVFFGGGEINLCDDFWLKKNLLVLLVL